MTVVVLGRCPGLQITAAYSFVVNIIASGKEAPSSHGSILRSGRKKLLKRNSVNQEQQQQGQPPQEYPKRR